MNDNMLQTAEPIQKLWHADLRLLTFTLPEPLPNMTLLECATRLVVGVVNAGKIIV